jgi:hypothetical protein
MFILHNKFGEEENDFLSSTFEEMSLTFHLLKRIHPYHRTHLFLTWGYMTPPMARILKTSGWETGSAGNRIKQ